MDYESLEPCDVLFLSDSLKSNLEDFTYKPFKVNEVTIIERAIKKYQDVKFGFSASVKCPDVKEADLTPDDRNICRQHLFTTIKKLKPKIIFACGNLSVVMLLKRSGVAAKRGSYFPVIIEGEEYKVIPLIHPMQVFMEPKYLFLFRMDIDNSINKYIYGIEDLNFEFSACYDKESLSKHEDLFSTEDPLACDTETTGLDFKKDKVQTVSFATRSKTVAFPIDHRHAKKEDREYFIFFTKKVLENNRNKKIFHNAKFDLKMLRNYDIIPVNVWDTQIMYHLIDENAPKSLRELSKRYFPEKLENL